MSKWFTANKLALNLDKTNIIKSVTNNSPQCALSTGYNGKRIEESANTKFLDLQIDDHLNWKNHIDQMIPKLSWACYAVRSMFHIVNIYTMKSIYFAYFQSIMKYGIILGGNSSNSTRVFTLQKKIIRIMAGAKPRNSCRSLFKKLDILPLPCEYIFSLMNFTVNNLELFQTNSTVHSVNTRNKNHLHRPIANHSCFQKGAHYVGIKIFNSLLPSLKTILDKETFKVALKRCLNTHTFYSVDEFLQFKGDS
jgi:hypothetical protein